MRKPHLTVPASQPHYREMYKICSSAICFLALAFLFAGCAGLKSDYDIAKERAEFFVAAHPDLPAEAAETIKANTIHNGMTMEQVIAAWGRPAEVQRYRNKALQLWYFGCDWPHFCKSKNRIRPDPDAIYFSWSLFQDGVVVDWGS